MITLSANNLYDLSPIMSQAFEDHGYSRPSRNGKVQRLPGLTSVEIIRPKQHVCLYAKRDANPFFHLIEALAMLSGRNSVSLLSFLASNMSNFSDDGVRFNAFYGERARVKWGDQLMQVINELRANPESRQAVVNLWDPADLLRSTKDKACNLCLIFSVEDGVVNMTTFNRSNDCVWGFLTGANMVHLPFFLEYVASFLGLSMGRWFHCSANMHVYDWNEKWGALEEDALWGKDPYIEQGLRSMPIVGNVAELATYDSELDLLMDGMGAKVAGFETGFSCLQPTPNSPAFIKHVAIPMFNAVCLYKLGRKSNANNDVILETVMPWVRSIKADDWRAAAQLWFSTRIS